MCQKLYTKDLIYIILYSKYNNPEKQRVCPHFMDEGIKGERVWITYSPKTMANRGE